MGIFMNNVFKSGLLLILLSPAVVIAQTETYSASISFSDLNIQVPDSQPEGTILLGQIPQFDASLGTLQSWSLTVEQTGTIKNGTTAGPYQTYSTTCTFCSINLSGSVNSATVNSGTSWTNLTSTQASSNEPLNLYAADPLIVVTIGTFADDSPAFFNDSGTIRITYTYGPGPTPAPEIDPASAASGLTLVFGGLAVLRGRRRA
jgi:hypothetical protein